MKLSAQRALLMQSPGIVRGFSFATASPTDFAKGPETLSLNSAHTLTHCGRTNMKVSKRTVVAGLAAIPTGLVVGGERLASAQSQGDVIGELANNEGIFVDGKTFKIARGKAKGDPSAQIARLGAKEVGPGAIIFRYRDKLYMVEGTPRGWTSRR